MYFLKLIFLTEDASKWKNLFVCADPALQITVNPDCLLYEKSGLAAGQLASIRRTASTLLELPEFPVLGTSKGIQNLQIKGKS